jgi:ABC-type branched-subunit amino acid transport system ATPase component
MECPALPQTTARLRLRIPLVLNPAERPHVTALSPQPLLQVRGLTTYFGGLSANECVSLGVARHQVAAVIGPNGSGKTTLLNAITGQRPPDDGEVYFDGKALKGASVAEIARAGLMRTSQEKLRSLWAVGGHSMRSRALECLGFVGLAERAQELAGELSYGQRKLLELAMALMSQPKMLLLDEPTAGVSPAMVPEVISRLRRVNQELGISILFVEHNMQVVAELAHEVHCLVRGRLIASGDPDQVRADPRVREAYLGNA